MSSRLERLFVGVCNHQRRESRYTRMLRCGNGWIPCNNPSMLSLLGVGSGPLDDGENSLTRFMIFLSVPDCCPRNLVSDADSTLQDSY